MKNKKIISIALLSVFIIPTILAISQLETASAAALNCTQVGAKAGYKFAALKCEAKKCPSGYNNLGTSSNCPVCCGTKGATTATKPTTTTKPGTTVAAGSSKLNCTQVGAKAGYKFAALKCEAKKCPSGYNNLGTSSNCPVCCGTKGTVAVAGTSAGTTVVKPGTTVAASGASTSVGGFTKGGSYKKLSIVDPYKRYACSDSDGGLNIWVKGTASRSLNRNTSGSRWSTVEKQVDTCLNSKKLIERTCINTNDQTKIIASKTYTCSGGCSGGMCL